MHKIQKQPEPEHFRLWKQQFLVNNGREALYSDLTGTEEYKKLKADLLKEQGYICCYCERQIGRSRKKDSDIEHFMPRHPDRRQLTPSECEQCENAQMDYNNIMASCLGEEIGMDDHCNHKKDNWYDFSLCVSPVEDEIEKLFGFRKDGRMVVLGGNAKAEAMRSHLNLNSHILLEQRKEAYDAVMEAEFENVELLNDEEYIHDTIDFYCQKDENGYYSQFCSMITYCMERELLD